MSNNTDDSMDMTQFYSVFFEEAAEHLDGMESLLLEIDLNSADEEQLNAIFRAAHSIKGGAATFGFQDITGLTHEMETVFDRVRKGQMPLSTGLVDAFLTSGDMLKSMLAARRGDGAGVQQEEVDVLCRQLRAFLELEAAEDAAFDEANGGSGRPARQALELVFAPLDDQFSSASVDAILVDLKDFGSLEELPGVAGAERRFRIVTEVSAADLADTIAFMADPERVKVNAFDMAPAEAAAVTESVTAQADDRSQGDKDFGLFVDETSLPANQPQAVGASQAGSNVLKMKGAVKPGNAAGGGDSASIRVSVEKVDQLINLVGELVITQAMLAQTASNSDPVLYEALFNGLAQLQRNTRDLQESAMSIRMMPMSFVFSRFPRVVRDVAAKLGKDVELQTVGESTELDKGLIERIVDPLTHLVRNSLDHGLEAPDERVAKGKARKGTITLRAYHQGGAIVIEVSDDGRGLRRDKILAKAKERGMAVSDAMSDQEVWQLIFEAGFSTADKITDVSGRGVGMDVVRRNIQEMGGRVEIDSAPDLGTRISIKLPLTLAILDGMSVRVGDEVFIVPLSYISESLQPKADAMRSLQGNQHVVAVRGDYLPVLSLAQAFNVRADVHEYDKGILVIIESEGAKTALFVDGLVGQNQVVIKSLETNYRKVAGISGATIMGDGRVAMIVDVAYLVGLANSRLDMAA